MPDKGIKFFPSAAVYVFVVLPGLTLFCDNELTGETPLFEKFLLLMNKKK